ncbi:phasin family protein [Paenibacillus jilunlii]|uniref:Polyhydroxyalkanoate synthesis regulator phasin n=1 Tax=Paenibacillus jilunlii TaxID=682956 RepID=A0A1G9PNA8_9BACL|nr:hypothetical protein [Paenibacillus jilunlii]KWX70600.1 hypothetical protein AML91_26425 [Paenibacillus jilunlii]SDM00286.1 Polyhydroxyalkanoate synthesis regulator phasin [Paenibacillus jilunlii]
MKTALEKAIMLGIGLAAAGKEQIELTVSELVKKGEVGRLEARALAEKLIHRKEEEQRMEGRITERVQAILSEENLAALEELKQLKLRVLALEQSKGLNN